MMILLSYGTRPEWIKIKPLIEKFREESIPFKVLFTGQQNDIAGGEFDRQIKMPSSGNSNRLDKIISSCLNNDRIYKDITHVIVQGDTSSALGIALSAFHRQIKVIHLEAGLRTYQKNPYPEEMNRSLIDVLSDVHLCPTPENALNLIKAGYPQESLNITGNTGLDNLYGMPYSYSNEVVVTMHRRENHAMMDKWLMAINDLAKANPYLSFITPIHPNPNVKKWAHLLTDTVVIEPVPYERMIEYVAGCKFLITDSGGLQEEASFFNKKAIVCRDCTERSEVLGIHSFLCKSPEELPSIFNQVNSDHIPSKHYCPYGDGKASERVVDIIKNMM